MSLFKIIFPICICFLFACHQTTEDRVEKELKFNRFQYSVYRNLEAPEIAYGELLRDVQEAKIYTASKVLLDAIPKKELSQILSNYTEQKKEEGFDLNSFINLHFIFPASDSIEFRSDSTRTIIEHITELVPHLTKEGEASKYVNGTLIPLANPHVVTHAQTHTLNYWESYFLMQGLKTQGKIDLLQSMVDNFADLIHNFGFVPASNRTYHLSRSQPPFFSLMVDLLAEEKGNEVYKEFLPALEFEYAFWMDGSDKLTPTYRTYRRVVRLSDGNILNRYWDDLDTPRPEFYNHDVAIAQKSDRPANELYRDIRAAAESGWDFSSRWLKDTKTMESIYTTNILPVDLNCLLYHLEMTLSKAFDITGKKESSKSYLEKAEKRKAAILNYHWHGPAGHFMDFDFTNGEPTYIPSLAGIYPLFLNMVTKEYATAAAQSLEEDFLRPGGALTTVHFTGHQWDAPYGWAPLQWMTIQGLRNYGYESLAEKIKTRWIRLCRKIYHEEGRMVEKYNIQNLKKPSGGADFEGVLGYGWTNAVLLNLMLEE